jgi:dynein heavy chain
MLRPLVEGSVDVYLRLAAELLPTPARAHYTFNLRDVSRVFQVQVFTRLEFRVLGSGSGVGPS